MQVVLIISTFIPPHITFILLAKKSDKLRLLTIKWNQYCHYNIRIVLSIILVVENNYDYNIFNNI